MKSNWNKTISYTLAACMLLGSVSVNADAIGATAGISSVTNVESLEANSYSTYAGVSLTVNNMLSNASTLAIEMQENEAEAVAQANNEYANIAIAQVDNYVYIRSEASAESEYVGKLYNNSAATVSDTVETEDGTWLLITSGDCTGYVKSEFVVQNDEELAKSVSRRVATVNGETLYVRSEPTTDSSVLDMIPLGDDLTVTDEATFDDGWVQVSCEGGTGYVSTQFVSLSTEFTVAESKAAEEARIAKEEAAKAAAKKAAAKKAAEAAAASASASASTKSYSAPAGSSGSAVVGYACQFVGNPYVYGGSSLTNGTDCSGFVMSVYSAFGVSLPHSSSALRSCGYGVDYASMQPGDIVCYSGHVAIYAGNGTIVHASNKRTGITYSDVNYKKILAIRRIF